jgi:hypothetical protein
MTTDNMVVDVSLDWVLACDVQQRFMQGWAVLAIRWTIARIAAKFELSAAIVMSSCLLRMSAWRWSLEMPPVKVSPRRS